MPPLKKQNPKEEFFKRAEKLLANAENSSDPAFRALRMEMAKRYFKADTLGPASVSPTQVYYTGIPILLVLATVAIVATIRLDHPASYAVFLICAFFGILVLILMLALAGVMTENAISKLLLNLWTKTLAKFSPKSSGKD
jgi:hypothetical protein